MARSSSLRASASSPIAVGAQGALHGMRRQQRVVAQAAKAGAAGPDERGGVVGHAGAHRIEVDVADAAQQVLGGVDQAGLVAAFPQRAGAAVAGVELPDVLAAKALHQLADGASAGRGHQQVHVVVHQDVGVHLAPCGEHCFVQQLTIVGAVFVAQETGERIAAALHHVLRDARQVKAWESGHPCRIDASISLRYRTSTQVSAGFRPLVGQK